MLLVRRLNQLIGFQLPRGSAGMGNIHGCPCSLGPRLLSLGTILDNSFLWNHKGKASLGNDPWEHHHPICRGAVASDWVSVGLPVWKAKDACSWRDCQGPSYSEEYPTDRAWLMRGCVGDREGALEQQTQPLLPVAGQRPAGSGGVLTCNHNIPSSPLAFVSASNRLWNPNQLLFPCFESATSYYEIVNSQAE